VKPKYSSTYSPFNDSLVTRRPSSSIKLNGPPNIGVPIVSTLTVFIRFSCWKRRKMTVARPTTTSNTTLRQLIGDERSALGAVPLPPLPLPLPLVCGVCCFVPATLIFSFNPASASVFSSAVVRGTDADAESDDAEEGADDDDEVGG